MYEMSASQSRSGPPTAVGAKARATRSGAGVAPGSATVVRTRRRWPCTPRGPDRLATLAQSSPHPDAAAGQAAVRMDLADLFRQRLIGAGTRRGWSVPPGEIARARHAQHPAEQPNGMLSGLVGDELERAHRGALARAK